MNIAPPPAIALFLNFEGVLHTPALDDYIEFEFMSQLEGVLRDFPNVIVVITSEQRIGANIIKLRQPFSEDIRPRVVGATPNLVLGRAFGGRVTEIEAYLKEIGGSHLPWIALDSEELLFPKDCLQLVHAHKLIGFSDPVEQELREKLTALSNPPELAASRAAAAKHADPRTLAEKEAEAAAAVKKAAPAPKSSWAKFLRKFRR